MLNLEKVDRIPLLGGFLVSGKHYQRITNISEDLFFEEPDKYAIGECGIVQNEKL